MTYFSGVEILRKGTVSTLFQAIHPTQNFNTGKLGEIKVFYAVIESTRNKFGLISWFNQLIGLTSAHMSVKIQMVFLGNNFWNNIEFI